MLMATIKYISYNRLLTLLDPHDPSTAMFNFVVVDWLDFQVTFSTG
jgi:hypothetical protein